MLVSFFRAKRVEKTTRTQLAEVPGHATPCHVTYRKCLLVTKYLQPITGASSLCEVTLEDFLPVRNVIPSVFCYFPDLRVIVDIFLRSYLPDSFQVSLDISPFLWAALSKFISAVPLNQRPCIASGLPEALLRI